jgi:hypothetical protein
MAGRVLKKRRLVNPGRRRRMTAKQIKFFGTKAQRNALKNRRRNASTHRRRYKAAPVYRRHNRRRNQSGLMGEAERAIHSVEQAAEQAIGDVTHVVGNRGRRRNVGEILTVIPANPGRRRRNKMARRTRNRRRNRGRVRVSNRRTYRRRYATRNRGHRRRTRNRNPRVVVRYRNRRHNAHRNRGHRRRNPNFLTGDAGAVVGLLGGAAVTKIIAGFLPSNLTTGWPGYISTGLVAVIAGQLAGRMTSNSRLGNFVTIGGLLIVGLQMASDLFPQLQLPFTLTTPTTTSGTSGMGLITSSNFFVPQVNLPGSMATFVPPAAIPAPVVIPATAMKGLGVATSTMNQGLRRIGRLR